MKRLTDNEIEFIKKFGWTPTLEQMNYSEHELLRTPFKHLSPKEASKVYFKKAEEYHINLCDLYDKTCNASNWDSISLEYDATYLLYTFFTLEELKQMNSAEALEWLKDFKYYCGYRKWDETYARCELNEAIQIHEGSRMLYEVEEQMWNKEIV